MTRGHALQRRKVVVLVHSYPTEYGLLDYILEPHSYLAVIRLIATAASTGPLRRGRLVSGSEIWYSTEYDLIVEPR